MFCRIACDLPQSTLIYLNFPQSTSIYFNFLSIYLNFPQFILLSYLYIPQFTLIYRDLHWFTSIYLILPQFTLIYLILHWFTPINIHLPQFTTFYLKFVSSEGALVAIPLPLFHITSSCTSKSLYNLLTHFNNFEHLCQ